MFLLQEMRKNIYWEETFKRMYEGLDGESLDVLKYWCMPENIDDIIESLYHSRYEWSIARKVLLKKVGSTKLRTVYMFSIKDRLVQGVLYRVMNECFKEMISINCYSYKKGVSTADAIKRLINEPTIFEKHAVKIDISSYFNSVNKDTIENMVDNIFENREEEEIKTLLKNLFTDNRVINNKNEIIEEYKSLIPGSAISSFFANYCLKDIDEKISLKDGIVYARYSDDIIIFGDTVKELENTIELIKYMLEEKGLCINDKKYEWFEPGDRITFLGLKMWKYNDERCIDIGDESLSKLKSKIKTMCNKSRKKIEMKNKNAEKEVTKILKIYNFIMFKCFIEDRTKYGWGYYAFRYVNTIESLRKIDFYLCDMLRYVYTGSHNKSGIKRLSHDKLIELGYISVVDMFNYFKTDFDLYCDKVFCIREGYIE